MKTILLLITMAIIFIIGAIKSYEVPNSSSTTPNSNVTVVNQQQIVKILAKGGYSPRSTTAKANMPTTLQIETNNTYDCSSSLSIPSIGYRSYLPPLGKTDIPIPAQKPGTTLQGLCSMGMYNFQINFN
jgi:plastocyanin domain-containing protein